MTDAVKADGTVAEEDAEPFEAFFARTFTGMLARALLLCGHRQDAEDAVQDAYAEAYRRWERLRGYEAPDAWVYRVVRQRLRAAGRRNARARAAGLEGLPAPAVAGVEQTAYARTVLAALATLPKRQRTVLVMHCLNGVPQRDVAEELGLSRGGVAASLSKARRRLQKVLGMRERAARGSDGADDRLVRPGVPMRGEELRPLSRAVHQRPEGDGLAVALAAAEAWLRVCVAAGPEAAARVRVAVLGRGGEGGPG
ncbi:RNA polymerase sigma factor [Streptomyces sp. JJ38]|uniref:RNA polymerase sigma factor n=1 Tax=Streptomyces sp. JJ38 TaxID=2738128 RepID=UPI001C59FDCB|nr:sigma-70 family RNA polymerase sigma factor [Streptomyces sp. JJ38]MBW1598621.1 sigma-70 family RNA polymerase sigma factor [Streptomyces sp. JJ38]